MRARIAVAECGIIKAVADPGDQDLAHAATMVPFAATLGIELLAASPEEVVGRLAWRPELNTMGAVIHGGALMALADHLGGVCAFLNLPTGAGTATISSSTNFLRPVSEGEVIATARPLRVGRTVIVVETELRDGEGRLVAQVAQAQAVLGGGGEK
jgi:1,4-dihydroxy-2-naphthoyl-CoA hydrolase